MCPNFVKDFDKALSKYCLFDLFSAIKPELQVIYKLALIDMETVCGNNNYTDINILISKYSNYNVKNVSLQMNNKSNKIKIFNCHMKKKNNEC